MKKKGMGSHQSARAMTETWLTPREIVDRLGRFDLDPCSAPDPTFWPTAAVHYTAPTDDGLALPWRLLRHDASCPNCGGVGRGGGATPTFCRRCRTPVAADEHQGFVPRVWLNPPYGRTIDAWMGRAAAHGRATALIFARTETEPFFRHVWEAADAALFLEGRLHFHHADGRRSEENAGAPSVLCAYGPEDVDSLMSSGIRGMLVGLKRPVLVQLALVERDASGTTTPWRDVVGETLAMLGGRASLSDLYAALEGHPRAIGNPSWRAKVRQTVGRMGLPREARGVYALAA